MGKVLVIDQHIYFELLLEIFGATSQEHKFNFLQCLMSTFILTAILGAILHNNIYVFHSLRL